MTVDSVVMSFSILPPFRPPKPCDTCNTTPPTGVSNVAAPSLRFACSRRRVGSSPLLEVLICGTGDRNVDPGRHRAGGKEVKCHLGHGLSLPRWPTTAPTSLGK